MSTFEKKLFVAGVVLMISLVGYGVFLVRIRNTNLGVSPNFSAPGQSKDAQTAEELEQELKFLQELLAKINEMTEEEKSEVSFEHLKFGLEQEIASLHVRLERIRSGVTSQETVPKKKKGMAI